MTPLELLARLAALVPPPRHPLIRFHGALAPRSSWRSSVVPKAPNKPADHATHDKPIASPPPTTSKPTRKSSTAIVLAPKTELLTPNVISLTHWQRLKNGALLARTTRIDWPTLLRRTFDTDVLECPKCTGRLKVIAVIDPANARTVLDELHIPRPPPPKRARDPTALFAAPETFDVHAE